MTFEECPGYSFFGGTCYRWDQTANQAGITVECNPDPEVTLNLRLDPENCDAVPNGEYE